MNNAGTAAGGTGGEVVALDQKHGFAGLRTLPCERNTIDSAADDDDLDALRQWIAPGKTPHRGDWMRGESDWSAGRQKVWMGSDGYAATDAAPAAGARVTLRCWPQALGRVTLRCRPLALGRVTLRCRLRALGLGTCPCRRLARGN